MSVRFRVHQLQPTDVPLMRGLNTLFGVAFNDAETYGAEPPGDAYLKGVLSKEHVIVLVALAGERTGDQQAAEQVVGGLVAYELDKLERARREIYIYDLAVAEEHRRCGIAMALIQRLRQIATDRAAWVIYVQADYGDDPAIALYEGLGSREEVLHYDIEVSKAP
jgi:aminoglycoside 3-N-acetyltransferase I